jgi:hypothetical protein
MSTIVSESRETSIFSVEKYVKYFEFTFREEKNVKLT